MRTIILSLLCLMTSTVMAQNAKSENVASKEKTPAVVEADKIYEKVEQNPCFPGGEGQFFAYMAKEIKYPQEALKAKAEGRVIIRFVVEKDGSITQPKILRTPHAACSEEALRIINAMPKWTPGKINGQPVRSYFSVPIMFRSK